MRDRLKVAIVRSGKSQRAIGAEAGISEPRLSTIVRGWVARPDERQALQRVLGVGPDVFRLPRARRALQ
jgi:hypothetical protein